MAVKHIYRRNEVLHTQFGTVELNEEGYIKNLEDFDAAEEDFLTLPNLIDGNTFRGSTASEEKAPTETSTKKDGKKSSKAFTDADYLPILKEIEKNAPEDKMNSEGFLDMDYLNGILREKGVPILSGGKRKSLSLESRKES